LPNSSCAEAGELLYKIEAKALSPSPSEQANWIGTCGFLLEKSLKISSLNFQRDKAINTVLAISFPLKAGKTYKAYFQNKLGKDFKNIDDYWFFKKRLDEMIESNEIPKNEESILKIISYI
jgi:hypothetical protein